jgi:hypothetical protein
MIPRSPFLLDRRQGKTSGVFLEGRKRDKLLFEVGFCSNKFD